MKYTVVVNGKPEGPYDLGDLKNLNIKPNTFIRTPEMDDYKEAHEILELRELLGFSYQQTAPQYFAAFDQRLLAFVIDCFIVFLGYCLILLVAFLIVGDKETMIRLAFFSIPVLFISKILYNVIAESSKNQGTIGKKVLGIKVTDMMGNRISFGKALGRNVAKILSEIPLNFGYIYCMLNKKNQCFHDIVAETLVIKDRLI